MSEVLDTAMIAAHEAHDNAALVRLYTQAADTVNDIDASCFYLTHAYVFALEAGAPNARALHSRLVKYGREA